MLPCHPWGANRMKSFRRLALVARFAFSAAPFDTTSYDRSGRGAEA